MDQENKFAPLSSQIEETQEPENPKINPPSRQKVLEMVPPLLPRGQALLRAPKETLSKSRKMSKNLRLGGRRGNRRIPSFDKEIHKRPQIRSGKKRAGNFQR
jgi:hypothetical protein